LLRCAGAEYDGRTADCLALLCVLFGVLRCGGAEYEGRAVNCRDLFCVLFGVLRCGGAGYEGRAVNCRDLFCALFGEVRRGLNCCWRAVLAGVRAANDWLVLELPCARVGLFCERAKALSRPALRFWIALLLVEVRPRLLVARDLLTLDVGRVKLDARFALATVLVGREPAAVAGTAPRPENSLGRAVAATAGRPLFTEANCARLALAVCSCWTCNEVAVMCRSRFATISTDVARALIPPVPPL